MSVRHVLAQYEVDAIDLVRLAFLGAAGGVYFVFFVPSLRSRFLAYGPRASSTISAAEQEEKKAKPKPSNPFETTLDRLATLQVPHSWFTSFYAVSVSCSLLWAADYVLSGPISSHIATYTNPNRPSMTFHQALLTWLAVLAQGTRRLYESHAFARPSTSTMWVGHWLLGLAFYAGLSLAVWIEALPALQTHTPALLDFSIQAPSPRTFLSLAFFLFASGIQHDCHAYLASLKTSPSNPTSTDPATNTQTKQTYKLPSHPAFHLTLTPHYLAETVIYLSLAFLAAPPPDAWLNGTLACALLFVGVNLGVTAHGTHEWYEAKFGKAALEGRWRMVPFVF